MLYKELQSSTIPFYIRTGSVVTIAVLKPKLPWQLGKYNSFTKLLILILLVALTAGGDQSGLIRGKETKKNAGPLNEMHKLQGTVGPRLGFNLWRNT